VHTQGVFDDMWMVGGEDEAEEEGDEGVEAKLAERAEMATVAAEEPRGIQEPLSGLAPEGVFARQRTLV